MSGKRKVIIRVGLGVCLIGGLVGGYFGIRELLAPRDKSLVMRVGLAGVYMVERDGQKFLVNSLGGMQKIESAKEPVPTSTPVDTRPSSPTSATEPNALPTPPPTSYAAHVLDLYRQSILTNQQYSEKAALLEQRGGDSADNNPSKRSSFVEDRPVKQQPQTEEAAPTPSPVVGGAPAPVPSPSPAAKILKDASVTEALNPPLTDTEASAAKRKASWAGLLAAQNVINPLPSAILALHPPVTSQNKARPTSDTAPSDRHYVVDDVLDTAPTDDGTETYTLVHKAPTPSPEDLVPSAAPSLTPAPEPARDQHPTIVAQKTKSHTKSKAKSLSKADSNDADDKPSFWKMFFGAKGSKQPDAKPIDGTKKTAQN